MGMALAMAESQTDLCAKAASYGVANVRVDGMDVVAVHEAVQRADNVEGQSERDNANCWQMVEVKDLRAIVDYVRALLGGPRA